MRTADGGSHPSWMEQEALCCDSQLECIQMHRPLSMRTSRVAGPGKHTEPQREEVEGVRGGYPPCTHTCDMALCLWDSGIP